MNESNESVTADLKTYVPADKKPLTATELFHIFSWVAMIGLLGLITISLIKWLNLPLYESYSFMFFIVMIYGFFESIKYYSKSKQ